MPSRILIVDDDVDSLNLISLMLKRQGYDVATAHSGTEALQTVVEVDPDLIILDVMMPDMDGYTVCRHLRSDDRTNRKPILMFTAKTLVDDKVAGFEAGADDYLTKPTHPAELAARVQAMLARSAQRGKNGEGQRPASHGYAFIGSKGGLGLSTLAMNVATILADKDPTSLVDFRPGHGTIGMTLGYGRSTGFANVASKALQEISASMLQEELIADEKSGVYLLPSSTRSRESQLKIHPDVARAIVSNLKQLTTNVVVDLGPGLTQTTMAALRDIDHIVLAVEANRVSLAMGRDILSELRQAGIPRPKTSVVIINRAEGNHQIPWQDAEQLLENEITAVISSASDLLFEAMEAQIPVVVKNPDSAITSQYNKLVEELVRRGRSD